MRMVHATSIAALYLYINLCASGSDKPATASRIPEIAGPAVSSALGGDIVDDLGADYPVIVDSVHQLAELTASDGATNDQFGFSAAASGNTVVVGALYATVPPNYRQGAAYVFVKSTNGWTTMTQTAKLTASDGMANDNFGSSVSISNNVIVVGSPNAMVGSNAGQGAVYLFVEPPTGWTDATETAKLTTSDGLPGDLLGYSVSISGNTVAAGAPQAIEAGVGKCYVFVKPVGGWANMTETAELVASNGLVGDNLGFSIATSGNTIVSGAGFAPYPGPGAAYVFTEPQAGWQDMTQTAELTASDGSLGDWFGYSVAISGKTIAAGAINKAPRGAAYVFVQPASGWGNTTQNARLVSSAGSGTMFGTSASILGNTVLVGAPWATQQEGAAYGFVEPPTGWTNMYQNATLTAGDGGTGDSFGTSAAITGSIGVVGAVQSYNHGHGAAFVFGK